MQRPPTTLLPGSHQDYIEQAQGAHQRQRMEESEARRMILEDDWRPLVWAKLTKHNYPDHIHSAIGAFIKREPNVANSVLRKVALAYRTPPTRTIAKASEASQKAFQRLVLEEAKLTTATQRWERLVWGLNVVITVPVVRAAPGKPFGRRLEYMSLLPSNTEVVLPDSSPTSTPIASVTRLGSVEGSAWPQPEDMRWVVLDENAWTTYDSRGRLIETAQHGAGVWPGTPWRRREAGDWWASEIGAGLFEATIEVAHISARLDYIRKGQDHKREFMFAEDLAQVPVQVAGADGPVEAQLAPGEISYQVHDAAVPIEQHVAHMLQHARAGAETLDVDPDLIDFKAGAEGIEPIVAAQKHDDLMALRQASIVHFSAAEKDSAWKTALVLRGAGHPIASLLQPSKVTDGYEAHWSDLDFVDHPKSRLEVIEMEIDLGFKSTVEAEMARHPTKSREQAKADIRQRDEDEAERAELLAERNLPSGVRDRLSDVPELQGRIGGMVSGESRSSNDDDDTDGGRSERSTAPARGRARANGSTARPPARARRRRA